MHFQETLLELSKKMWSRKLNCIVTVIAAVMAVEAVRPDEEDMSTLERVSNVIDRRSDQHVKQDTNNTGEDHVKLMNQASQAAVSFAGIPTLHATVHWFSGPGCNNEAGKEGPFLSFACVPNGATYYRFALMSQNTIPYVNMIYTQNDDCSYQEQSSSK